MQELREKNVIVENRGSPFYRRPKKLVTANIIIISLTNYSLMHWEAMWVVSVRVRKYYTDTVTEPPPDIYLRSVQTIVITTENCHILTFMNYVKTSCICLPILPLSSKHDTVLTLSRNKQ